MLCSSVEDEWGTEAGISGKAEGERRVCNNTRTGMQACMYGMDQKNNFSGHNLNGLKTWAKWVSGRLERRMFQ